MESLMSWGDGLCNFCIAVMEEMAKMTGISYGTINILLFVIIGPLSTLMFMATSVIYLSRWRQIKAAAICGKVFFAAGIACMCIVALMVLYVLIFGNIDTNNISNYIHGK